MMQHQGRGSRQRSGEDGETCRQVAADFGARRDAAGLAPDGEVGDPRGGGRIGRCEQVDLGGIGVVQHEMGRKRSTIDCAFAERGTVMEDVDVDSSRRRPPVKMRQEALKTLQAHGAQADDADRDDVRPGRRYPMRDHSGSAPDGALDHCAMRAGRRSSRAIERLPEETVAATIAAAAAR